MQERGKEEGEKRGGKRKGRAPFLLCLVGWFPSVLGAPESGRQKDRESGSGAGPGASRGTAPSGRDSIDSIDSIDWDSLYSQWPRHSPVQEWQDLGTHRQMQAVTWE